MKYSPKFLPETCPGCGAPYQAQCKYCGRGKPEKADKSIKKHNVVNFSSLSRIQQIVGIAAYLTIPIILHKHFKR